MGCRGCFAIVGGEKSCRSTNGRPLTGKDLEAVVQAAVASAACRRLANCPEEASQAHAFHLGMLGVLCTLFWQAANVRGALVGQEVAWGEAWLRTAWIVSSQHRALRVFATTRSVCTAVRAYGDADFKVK